MSNVIHGLVRHHNYKSLWWLVNDSEQKWRKTNVLNIYFFKLNAFSFITELDKTVENYVIAVYYCTNSRIIHDDY